MADLRSKEDTIRINAALVWRVFSGRDLWYIRTTLLLKVLAAKGEDWSRILSMGKEQLVEELHSGTEAVVETRRATYAHRNGDTEAPTMPGKYWFSGTATLWTGRINLRTVLDCTERDGRILAWEERSQYYLLLGHFAGQWWGPVEPPWTKG